MEAKTHRLLVTIGSIAAGIGGIVGLSDYAILNIPPEVGAALSLSAAVLTVVANAIRANWGSDGSGA